MFLLTAALACDLPVSFDVALVDDTDALPVADTDAVVDTDDLPAAHTDTGEAEPIVPEGVDLPEGSLFDESVVHRVHILLDEETTAVFTRDDPLAREYHPADVTIDGNAVGPVGIRLKGSSSWRTLDQKAGFKLDINFVQPGLEYDGYTKLNLNNMVNDTTQLHEILAWEVFRAAGLPAQRCSYAWVTVNGEDFGLYLLLETPDQDKFLERTWGHDDGRVYEGGYPNMPMNASRAELTVAEAPNFDLEKGDDVANADVIAAAERIDRASATWDADVAPFLDTERYATFHMAEVWVGQWDGYVSAVNNYRVYAGPDGQIEMLASGLDWSFTHQWGGSRGSVARRCEADATCAERLRNARIAVSAAADGAGLVERFDRLQALIQPYVEADPRKETDTARIAAQQGYLRGWLQTRSGDLEALFP